MKFWKRAKRIAACALTVASAAAGAASAAVWVKSHPPGGPVGFTRVVAIPAPPAPPPPASSAVYTSETERLFAILRQSPDVGAPHSLSEGVEVSRGTVSLRRSRLRRFEVFC